MLTYRSVVKNTGVSLVATLLACCILFASIPPVNAESVRSIAIDPGHGGESKGCIGPQGTMEKDINLQIALRLEGIIKEQLGIKILLTRKGDDEVELARRTAQANHEGADLFISLHANSSFYSGQSGLLMLFVVPPQDGVMGIMEGSADSSHPVPWDTLQIPYRDKSLLIANLIAEEAKKSGIWLDAIIKNAPLLVLEGAAMPAVVIEIDFLTSHQGEERLKEELYQEKVCGVILNAIKRYGFQTEEDPNETVW